MASISDKELVEAFLKGEKQWVEYLVSAYYAKVFALAVKVLPNEADAGDITQDTFIRVFEKLHQFRFKSSLQTWILNIAYNLCMNKLKSGKRLQISYLDENNSDIPSGTDDSDEEFSYREIEESFFKLSKEEQLYLELFYLNECSIRDIACILNRSETAVKTAVFRARTKLRTMIKKQSINGQA